MVLNLKPVSEGSGGKIWTKSKTGFGFMCQSNAPLILTFIFDYWLRYATWHIDTIYRYT